MTRPAATDTLQAGEAARGATPAARSTPLPHAGNLARCATPCRPVRLEAVPGWRAVAGRRPGAGRAAPTPCASRIGRQGGGWGRRHPPPRCNPPHARKLPYSATCILAMWHRVQAVLRTPPARQPRRVLPEKLRYLRRQYPTRSDDLTRRRVACPREACTSPEPAAIVPDWHPARVLSWQRPRNAARPRSWTQT